MYVIEAQEGVLKYKLIIPSPAQWEFWYSQSSG